MKYVQSSGLSLIWKYISLMSQTTAKAFLLNRIKTSNRSFWSFGPVCIKSFSGIQSFFAEASNTVLVLAVSLSVLTTGKYARKLLSFVVSTCLIYPFLRYWLMVSSWALHAFGFSESWFSIWCSISSTSL